MGSRAQGCLQLWQKLASPGFLHQLSTLGDSETSLLAAVLPDASGARRRHFQQRGVADSLRQQGVVGLSNPWRLQLVEGAVC